MSLIFCSTVVACRNPHLAAERARKREDLLTATEALLAKTRDQVTAGRIRGAGKIGVRAGKIINRYKVAKHFILDITDDHLAWRRDQTAIDAEAALDGIYILRTPVPAAALDAPAAVTAYKNLARENATSGRSKATTWTCGRSTTGSAAGSAATS